MSGWPLSRSKGYKTKVFRAEVVVGGVLRGAWTCNCTKVLVPSYEAIVATEQEVDEIGRRFGGHGDGFGSFGNALEN